MLGRLDKRLIDQASYVFFLIDLGQSKRFIFICVILSKKIKKKLKGFLRGRFLVDELFVPSAKWTSVIYCRLTDFKRSFRIPFLRLFWNQFYNFSRFTCFLRIDIIVDQRDRTRRALLQHKFSLLFGLVWLLYTKFGHTWDPVGWPLGQ